MRRLPSVSARAVHGLRRSADEGRQRGGERLDGDDRPELNPNWQVLDEHGLQTATWITSVASG